MIEATVVLPLRHLEPAREGIDSLLAQTMPADKMELIIIDAGLEGNDAAVLRDMAAVEPKLRLASAPAAQSSMAARTGVREDGGFRFANAGLDHARGEYIMFASPSRVFVPDALERLHALGLAAQVDVVLSRTGNPEADLSPELAHGHQEQALRAAVMLLDDQASDKLFRTSLLRMRSIHFRPVCETLLHRLFATEVFCASATITIDNEPISSPSRRSRLEASAAHGGADEYGSGLRQVLDVVDARTGSESVRTMFMSELVQSEILKRVGRPELASRPTAEAWTLVGETRGVWQERIPLSLDGGLGHARRAMAAAVRSGTPEEIAELAIRIATLQPRCWLTSIRVEAPLDVRIGLEVRMRHGDQPLRLLHLQDTWTVPSSITGPFLSSDRSQVVDPTQMSAEVVLRHQRSKVEVNLPSTVKASIVCSGDHGELVWTGFARLDPQATAIDRPLGEGRYDVLMKIRALGLTWQRKLGPNRLDDLDQLPLMVEWHGQPYEYAYTGGDNFSLTVGARASSVFKALRTAAIVVEDDGLAVDTGIVHAGPHLALSLTLTPKASGLATRLRLTPGESPGHWTAQPTPLSAAVQPGTYRPALNVIFRSSKSGTLLRRSIRLNAFVQVTDPLFFGRSRGVQADAVRQKVAAWSRLTKRLRRSLRRTTS